MSGYLAFKWGDNEIGQVGDNTILRRLTPVSVFGTNTFVKISTFGSHTLAIDNNGKLYAWGNNNSGQLGDNTTQNRSIPVAVCSDLIFQEISAGGDHSLAIDSTGQVYAWGNGSFGRLGDGLIQNQSVPVPVVGGLTFSKISAGNQHSLGITTTGVAYAWGLNNQGRLGIGASTGSRITPTAVCGGLTFIAITAGLTHSVGLTTSGLAYAWGNNFNGQLGNNSTSNRCTPDPVFGGIIFSAISAQASNLAITNEGICYSWGPGLSGVLGNNDIVDKSTPVAVCGGLQFVKINSGNYTSFGLTSSGQAYSWGTGVVGQLGNGLQGVGNFSLVPIPVLQNGKTFYDISYVAALGENATPTPTQTPTPTNTPTPQPTPVFQLINECEPITMFELGIICETIQEPTTSNSYDGIIRAQVTGGTIPYFYYWIQGQRTPILSNLTYGSYPITVVDYYGDFTASTICRLIPPSPTPSPTATMTPTPTSTPVCQPLCLIALNSDEQYGPWEFICNGIMNGRQKWTYESDEWSLNIVWNPILTRWQVNGVDLNTPAMIGGNKVMISTSTSQVPISQWNFYGTVNSPFLFSVTQNPCPPNLPLLALVETQNTLCPGEQNCTGSIIFQGFGGVPPYVYSINNGVSYQTNDIFTNLCSGTYTTVIKDFMNTTYKQTVVINSNSLLENYVVSVNSLSETTIPTDGNQVPTAPCGGAYNGTFAGMGATIQIQPLDLTNSYDNYNVIVLCNSGIRPNKFNVYDDLGDLIGNTGWLGQANYSGPWGTTLNNSGLGEINFVFTLPRTYELRVEVGPASMTNPITDSWDVTVTCDITLPSLPGIGKIQNTEFEVVFNPPLSQGTFIALDLIIQYDIDNMGPWYNSNPNQTAGYLFEATVNKSGVDVSNDLVQTPITTQLTPRPNCSPSQISSSASTYTLSVVMGYGDTLTGTTICQISQINPVSDGSCISTIESYIEIYTTNSRLSGCSTCADIVNSNTPVEYTQSVVGTQLTPVVNVSSIMAAMQPCGGGSIDDHIAYTIYLTGPAPTDVQYSLRITIIGTAGENPVFDVFGFVPQGMTFDPNGLNACNGQSIEFNVSSINYCLVSVEGNAPQDLYCIN